MPGTSLVLTVTVYQSDGSTAQASASVTITNESTSETQSADTDSSGVVIFNLDNFDSSWTSGDIITIHAVYGGSDATEQFTAATSTSETLTLTTATTTAALRYFETSDFYTTFGLSNYTDDSTDGIRESRITEIGAAVEAEIDNMLNTKFDSGNTSTDEYHDAKEYQDTWFLRNIPVQSLTSFSINEALPDEEEDWDDLADTDVHDDTDLDVDLDTGRVKITNAEDLPAVGNRQVKATYTYGRSSVPSDIKWLAMLMTIRRLAGSTLGRVTASGIENSGLGSAAINIANFDKEINDIIESRRIGRIRNV